MKESFVVRDVSWNEAVTAVLRHGVAQCEHTRKRRDLMNVAKRRLLRAQVHQIPNLHGTEERITRIGCQSCLK